jgi:hypothetical protein
MCSWGGRWRKPPDSRCRSCSETRFCGRSGSPTPRTRSLRRSRRRYCTRFQSERRQALKIPTGTAFYEESTFWNPSWTITHGAIQTTTSTTWRPAQAGWLRQAADEGLLRQVRVDRPAWQNQRPARLRDLHGERRQLHLRDGNRDLGQLAAAESLVRGRSRSDGLPSGQEDLNRHRRHVPTRRLRRPGQLPQRSRYPFSRIARELAPDDAPPAAPK